MPINMGKWFPSKGRRTKRAENRLGVIQIGEGDGTVRKVRDSRIENIDRYFDGKAYDHLINWNDAAHQENYVPVKNRKPLVNFNGAKIFSKRISSKLVGKAVFPTFHVADDPDTEEFIKILVKTAKLPTRLLDTLAHMANGGSSLARFYVDNGSIKMETYRSNWCYPEFQPSGDLKSCRIQYTFHDSKDLDEKGKPTEKWFRIDLGMFQDTRFDTPEYKPDVEPDFKIVNQVSHGLGFVQAEWFKTTDDPFSIDGMSLVEDALPFIDDLNYSLSQSSQSVGYNQDPQLTVKGMDIEELDKLIRSSQKAWNLGRDGDAKFVESDLGAVERAGELRDKMRLAMTDLTRVVLMDPEKMVAHAQSGRAMEVLHGPFVELIEELRPQVEDRIVSLVLKIMITTLFLNRAGAAVPVNIPKGYQPKHLNLLLEWPPVFPQTTADLLEKIRAITTATSANVISRETGTRKLAKDFNVENVEEEIQKIADQPIINPFGAF